ncbi:hypothetical protein [Afipia sp. P52-10]|uniref:hypothetical protein n=1 Tax=Afipia sp. P52-10 TaxID=1429916 RepID=UPI0012694AEF|nr:hypothetical protein [Afipia sp. P52-10]
MFDYDARYRELRAAGFEGWAGYGFKRGYDRLSATLDRLQRDGRFCPPPPSEKRSKIRVEHEAGYQIHQQCDHYGRKKTSNNTG